MGNIKIAPSLLAADWGHLATELERVEQADLLHLDAWTDILPKYKFWCKLCKDSQRTDQASAFT